VVVVLAIAISGSGAAPKPVGVPALTVAAPEKCRSARAGVAYYRALTWQRQDARGGERADRTPVARGRSCHWARYVVGVWAARAHDARIALEKWRYLFDWRSWLPRNWYELGSCETGYGGDPNWEHRNSSYTSAFGISVREYDADAAYKGAPPWNVRHTPRDQYLAALGHLERFGDGWGCPGP
jgi:hypothetical protein